MKIVVLRVWGFVLQLGALLLLPVACVPILYPAVLLVSSVIILLAIILMVLYPSERIDLELKALKKNKQQAVSRPGLRERMRSRAATRWAWRALWLSISSIFISFILMVAIKLISWTFYINPLDRELEPYRQISREHEVSRRNSGADRIGEPE